MLALGVGAVVLGIIGWREQLTDAGLPARPIDAFYLTIQLFTLQVSGVPDADGFPLTLQLARFVAPAVAGYAAFRAFLAIFREASQRLSVRYARDHVIVCGLGDAGLRMVRSLRSEGRRVVAIERSPDAAGVEIARDAGARVVIGDARDPNLLSRVGLDRATQVLALCGQDAVNGEVALALADLTADRQGSALDCRIHIADLGLSARLRTRELGRRPAPGVAIDFFNLFEAGARVMFARHPPFPDRARQARVAVVGGGDFGRAVIIELARLWSVADRDRPLDLVYVASGGEAELAALDLRFPGLGTVCAIEVMNADPQAPDLADRLVDPARVTPVYVCLDDEADGLAVSLALTRSLRPALDPVVVRTEHDRGLANLLERRAGGEATPRPFGLLDASCDPEVVFGGVWETMARAAHENYVAEAHARGETAATNPAAVPWTDLPESLRESNRDQARHAGAKLRAIGARPAPVVTAGGGEAQLTEEEVEQLAVMEHERWCEERRRQGWTIGPKDHTARTTPHLVPWDELDDETRELDRDAIRALPRLLALAGHRIERTAALGDG